MGPSFGVAAVDILAEDAEAGVECLNDREGLVSCGEAFRDLAALAGFDAAFVDPARTSGLFGEVSRELKGEVRAEVGAGG